ncbi:MAG TPA: FAD-dependent monooxygenase [Devosia sp.]|jgi:2-octaprenyl-6-methoxyphenol hydroxylase
MDAPTKYDVLIVGAGPVGLTLALALVQSARGIRIGLVDRRALTIPKDNRASAIAAGVRRVFEALGVWPAMLQHAQAVTAMRITDSGQGDLARPRFLTFEGDVVPGEPFAHMVPNQVIAQTLLDALGTRIDVVAPAQITSFAADEQSSSLQLADGREFRTPLIIAADGAQSALRHMAGIAVLGQPYEQMGLVATISHELPHEGVAYEHFRPAGPFASLPLPGQRSSLVWTQTTDEARRILALDSDAAAREIEAAMGYVLGTVTLEDQLAGYPLQLQIARDFVGTRLALVGDAAHVVHPIAGQGLNLGLKDVAALAETLVGAIRLGLDHGAADTLARYQAWRRFDTASMAAMTHGLNALFSNDIAPIRAARDLGLSLVDRTGPAKSALIRTAAGIDQNGPRLLSGLPI